MKSLLFAAAVSFTSVAMADTPEIPFFDIDVTSRSNEIELGLTTTETYSSMCFRSNKDLRIVTPQVSDQIGIPRPAIGLISLNTYLDVRMPCLMAFGPHRAALSLKKGSNLPEIAEGYYRLDIDNQHYGYLEVRARYARLVSASDLPQ